MQPEKKLVCYVCIPDMCCYNSRSVVSTRLKLCLFFYMSKRKINVQEIIDIVTNADDSDLSELCKEEECDNNDYEAVLPNNEQSDAVESNGEDSTDEDDNLPLSVITEDKEHVYRWQKRDVPQGNQQFTGECSPPLVQKKTPLEYFTMFFSQSLLRMIVDTTNLYSVKKQTPKVSKQL